MCCCLRCEAAARQVGGVGAGETEWLDVRDLFENGIVSGTCSECVSDSGRGVMPPGGAMEAERWRACGAAEADNDGFWYVSKT